MKEEPMSPGPIEPKANVCTVCGEPAFLRNFGAVSCNACAAFFRRSIVLQKNYACKNQKKCLDATVKTCRFCRLYKCLNAGMKPDCVRVNTQKASIFTSNPTLLTPSSDSILEQLILCRRASYFNRIQMTFKDPTLIYHSKTTDFSNMTKICVAEFRVLAVFLESTGVSSLVPQNDLPKLYRDINSVWILFEMGLATIRHGGLATNAIYFIDETYREIKEEKMIEFYSVSHQAKNLDVVAKAECDFHREYLNFLRQMYQYRFDENEIAVLIQLLLMGIACEVSSDKLKTDTYANLYIKRLFRALHKYYIVNNKDYAVQMGNVITLLGELKRIIYASDYLRSVFQLNDIWIPIKTESGFQMNDQLIESPIEGVSSALDLHYL